jgi:hypothetical protein
MMQRGLTAEGSEDAEEVRKEEELLTAKYAKGAKEDGRR